MKRIGLNGATFVGISDYQRGIRDGVEAQLIHVGSGPFGEAELGLAEAWVFMHHENLDALRLALDAGIRVLSRSVTSLPLGVPVVHMDDEDAAYRLARHELAQGAKTLHYLGVPAPFSVRRATGVRKAAQEADVPFSEHADLAAAVAALKEAASAGPAGFVGMNDERCYMVAEALHGSGLSVPGNVLLAGFDNLPLPQAPWSVALTTCVLPLREQGQLTARLLTAPEPPAVGIHLTSAPAILTRASTGC